MHLCHLADAAPIQEAQDEPKPAESSHWPRCSLGIYLHSLTRVVLFQSCVVSTFYHENRYDIQFYN